VGDRDVWDPKAEEWAAKIGDEGDENRRYQSDPVLWRLAGDVRGLRVLDLGCGTGYLTLKLAARGGKAIGVDVSPKMIQVAKRRAAAKGVRLDLRVDDAAALATVPAGSIDLVLSNYVLMDATDLDGCVRSAARVLVPRGRAIFIFSHPCFPLEPRPSYFEEHSYQESWGPFSTPFVVHHRPLSRYVGAFLAAGFGIETIEEPVVPKPCPPALDPARFEKARHKPWSIAFALRKAGP
jgi:SAM-dependent methyltransferase